LSNYYTEIAKDTGMFCYGVRDTITALESSALEALIVFEELECERIEMKDTVTEETLTKYISPERAADDSNFKDRQGVAYDILAREQSKPSAK